MNRFTTGHFIIAVLLIIALVLGVLVYLTNREVQDLEALLAKPAAPVADTSIAPPPVPEAVNPHAAAIKQIETDSSVFLSRVGKLIIRDEGKRTRPYLDSGGTPTIGVGRNLSGNGVSVAELHAIVNEIDYRVVLSDTHVQNGRVRIGTLQLANKIFTAPLTEHDILLLLTDDLKNVVNEAEKVFPQTWGKLDAVRKEVIVDVLFNLGLPRFKQFTKFIGAVKIQDWKTAASELLLSEAAHENPERFFRNSRIIRTGDARYFEL